MSVGGFGQSDSALPAEFAAMRPALCDKPADFIDTGCNVCPAFMFENAEHTSNSGLGVNSVLFGSFTSLNKTEAFLSSVGCFDHAEGYASAFLLRKEQGSWRRLSFFHKDGPLGICSKIVGQGDMRDSLLCNYEDYGAGGFRAIAFDASGKVKTESVLVQTWAYPGFRSEEKQKHCSTVDAQIKNVSFGSIEISIFMNSFDVDPPINCFNESEDTSSTISNSRKVESTAIFIRNDDSFAPDEKTKKLLAEIAKSR